MASLPGYLCIGGDEIINSCRTLAYMSLGLAPAWAGSNTCDCCCEFVDDGDYTTPATGPNPAPWYDPSRPESGEFYGFFTSDFYSSVPLENRGGRTGRGCAQPSTRTFTLTGSLVASTCRGTEYGKEWLARALNNVCIMDGCCPEREALIQRWCTDDGSGERTAIDMRMVSIEYKEGQDAIPCCEGALVEVILESDPWLYGQPTACMIDSPWDLDPDNATCIDWCSNCPEPATPIFNPNDPCGPQFPIAPSPAPLSVCWCEPILSTRQCCNVTSIPQWSDSVLRISIHAGGKTLRNLRLRVWPESPTLLDPSTPAGEAAFHCFPECAIAEIVEVPAFATLVIDGVTRSITLTTPGGVTTNADNLVFGPSRTLWDHPALICGAANWVCADADIYNTAVNATITIELIPREIG